MPCNDTNMVNNLDVQKAEHVACTYIVLAFSSVHGHEMLRTMCPYTIVL